VKKSEENETFKESWPTEDSRGKHSEDSRRGYTRSVQGRGKEQWGVNTFKEKARQRKKPREKGEKENICVILVRVPLGAKK